MAGAGDRSAAAGGRCRGALCHHVAGAAAGGAARARPPARRRRAPHEARALACASQGAAGPSNQPRHCPRTRGEPNGERETQRRHRPCGSAPPAELRRRRSRSRPGGRRAAARRVAAGGRARAAARLRGGAAHRGRPELPRGVRYCWRVSVLTPIPRPSLCGPLNVVFQHISLRSAHCGLPAYKIAVACDLVAERPTTLPNDCAAA
jgi:hypothetical protein